MAAAHAAARSGIRWKNEIQERKREGKRGREREREARAKRAVCKSGEDLRDLFTRELRAYA